MAKKLKTGPANFLKDGTKKPFAASPTNFLKDKKKPKTAKKPGLGAIVAGSANPVAEGGAPVVG